MRSSRHRRCLPQQLAGGRHRGAIRRRGVRLAPARDDVEAALALAERIRAPSADSASRRGDVGTLSATVSIGVAMCPRDGTDATSLDPLRRPRRLPREDPGSQPRRRRARSSHVRSCRTPRWLAAEPETTRCSKAPVATGAVAIAELPAASRASSGGDQPRPAAATRPGRASSRFRAASRPRRGRDSAASRPARSASWSRPTDIVGLLAVIALVAGGQALALEPEAAPSRSARSARSPGGDRRAEGRARARARHRGGRLKRRGDRRSTARLQPRCAHVREPRRGVRLRPRGSDGSRCSNRSPSASSPAACTSSSTRASLAARSPSRRELAPRLEAELRLAAARTTSPTGRRRRDRDRLRADALYALAVFLVPLVLMRKTMAATSATPRSEQEAARRGEHDPTQNVSLEEANRLLRDRSTEALEGLSATVDARDAYTAGHSRRVREIALAIGNEIGLSQDELEILGHAALFHDIGKIAIPDAILMKPRRLSSDEWAVMQIHPEEGADIIDRLGFLDDAVPAIRHHHENFDGTGYPDGLGRRGDPARRAHHPRRGRARRDDDEPHLPAGGRRRTRSRSFAAGAGSQFCPRCVARARAPARPGAVRRAARSRRPRPWPPLPETIGAVPGPLRSAELQLRAARHILPRAPLSRRRLGRPDDRLVLVVGSPRSGTTFLARSLGSLPGFIDLGEVAPLKAAIPELADRPVDETATAVHRILTRARRLGLVGEPAPGRADPGDRLRACPASSPRSRRRASSTRSGTGATWPARCSSAAGCSPGREGTDDAGNRFGAEAALLGRARAARGVRRGQRGPPGRVGLAALRRRGQGLRRAAWSRSATSA